MLAITMTQGNLDDWNHRIYGSVWNLCGCFFRTWQKRENRQYIHRVIW